MKAISTRTRSSRNRQSSLHDSMEARPSARARARSSSSRGPSSAEAASASAAAAPYPSASTTASSSALSHKANPPTSKRGSSSNSYPGRGSKRSASRPSSETSNVPALDPAGARQKVEASTSKRSKRRRVASSSKTATSAKAAKTNVTKASKRLGASVPAPATQSVTPSPAVFARKESSSSGANDDSSSETTPLRTTNKDKRPPTSRNNQSKSKSDDDDNDDVKKVAAEVTATPAAKFNRVNRQVTLDTTTSSDPLAIGVDINPTPSFHQPWHSPHGANLPKGVIDIDAFPHQCCQNSRNSHAGYSWITSKRRCHCSLDANHCSTATTLEIYMGTYGTERFGSGSDILEEDWRTEQWWLDLYRKERSDMEDSLKSKGPRSPSPTSPLSGDDVNDSLLNLFPVASSLEDHLDYMERQPDLNVGMRAILMDWLVELAEEYKLDSETMFLVTTLVDRALACGYLKKNGEEEEGDDKIFPLVRKDYLQCVGCACTLIASKLLEITPPTADEMVYISDNSFNRPELLKMEREICKHLKFNFNHKTPYTYINRFLRASYASSESSLAPHRAAMRLGIHNANNAMMERLVVYLLDLSTLEYKLVSVKPSLITASAIYLARATLGIREPTPLFDNEQDFGVIGSSPSFRRAAKGFWSKTLEHYTGYDMWDLEDTVKILRRLHENAETSNLKSVFAKHKTLKYLRVAHKTVVNESDLGFF